MSASVNRITLIGHLGRDPETRRFNDGNSIVSFSVATSESWKDKGTGERKDRTEWHQVTIGSEGLGKIAEQYLRKGSKVYLEGQMRYRKWTDKEGAERISSEVYLGPYAGSLVLLDKAGERGERDSGGYEQPPSRSGGGSSSGGRAPMSDDIPF
jgi:single-strand DNA-binding protein